MSARHLVLVGMMGAGKSTVGEACASRLGRGFVDTDTLVEANSGETVAELFERGEAEFRAWERRAIADVAASPVPLVVACGGGAVIDPENRRALRASGVVVWLRATPETLAARVGDGTDRPLLASDPIGALRRLASLRDDAYTASADVVIDVDHHAVDQVVDAVTAAYEAHATEVGA